MPFVLQKQQAQLQTANTNMGQTGSSATKSSWAVRISADLLSFTPSAYFYLLQSFKVFSQESHGSVRSHCAQLHNAILQKLLDVVFLDIKLTFPKTALLLTAAAAGSCHCWKEKEKVKELVEKQMVLPSTVRCYIASRKITLHYTDITG